MTAAGRLAIGMTAAITAASSACAYEPDDCRNYPVRYVDDRATPGVPADDALVTCRFFDAAATLACEATDGDRIVTVYPSRRAFVREAAAPSRRAFDRRVHTRDAPDVVGEPVVTATEQLGYDDVGRLTELTGDARAERYHAWDARDRPIAGVATTLACRDARVAVSSSDGARVARWTYTGGVPEPGEACVDRVELWTFDHDGWLVQRTTSQAGVQRTESITVLETNETCEDER
jgi:hypothetical protein